MADLVVTLADAVPDDIPAYRLPLADLGSLSTETIAIGGTSAAGSLLGTDALYVALLTARADCWVKVGTAPTAVAGEGLFMPNGTTVHGYISVGHKVAVIQDA